MNEDDVKFIELPGGESASICELMPTLMNTMPRSDLRYHAQIYKDCFTGRDGVKALMSNFHIESIDEAVELGRRLQDAQLLDHVCSEHKFGNTGKYFRLQPYQEPRVLNSYQKWARLECPDVMDLMLRLKSLMDRVENNATDPSTGMMDYIAAESDEDYKTFEREVCELHCVSMEAMKESFRLAFCINIYNMMIKHAFIKVGIPKTIHQRGAFYGCVSYNIGGHILSLDQIEHGIMRANSRPPYSMRVPFSKKDKALGLAMHKIDPRMHFAINCGANSCPPVTFFTENVEEELNVVAKAFCEDDDNVSIDIYRWELELSMIFHWYQSDFAASASKLPAAIQKYLEGVRKESVGQMVSSDQHVNVRFMPYDWGVRAKSSRQFTASQIAPPNEVSLKAFFSPNFKSKIVA